MEVLLEAKNLSKCYYHQRAWFRRSVASSWAVRSLCLDVYAGQCLGILGPNGAGKTSLLKMLEGLMKPSGGEVLYRGCRLDSSFKLKAGIQLQSMVLPDFITVRETLNLFKAFYPRPLEIDELIRLCSLEETLDNDNRNISGGQLQRLSLALALINDPEIVFLDEPTTGLDPQMRLAIWDVVRRLGKRTILLSTHYMEEAQALCDRVLIMDCGQIIADGSPNELIARYFSGMFVVLEPTYQNLLTEQCIDFFSRGAHLEVPTAEPEALISKLEKLGIPFAELEVRKPSLEDVFLHLTGRGLRDG